MHVWQQGEVCLPSWHLSFTPSNKKAPPLSCIHTFPLERRVGGFGAPGEHSPSPSASRELTLPDSQAPSSSPRRWRPQLLQISQPGQRGVLAEGVLPAGQTLSPRPSTSGFSRPQNCP